MKTAIVRSLTDTFEGHAQRTEGGVEFWLARDLQHLLGYTEWRNFTAVIVKARTACEVSGHAIEDHFVEVTKMVDLGSGSQREVDDIMLTGVITGNLLGAMMGESAIPQRWLSALELREVIREVADDLLTTPNWCLEGGELDGEGAFRWRRYLG